jgi:hypothetical protein
MSPVSDEYVLYTLAQVPTTLAGFSGLVVVFRVRGAQAWSWTRHLQDVVHEFHHWQESLMLLAKLVEVETPDQP